MNDLSTALVAGSVGGLFTMAGAWLAVLSANRRHREALEADLDLARQTSADLKEFKTEFFKQKDEETAAAMERAQSLTLLHLQQLAMQLDAMTDASIDASESVREYRSADVAYIDDVKFPKASVLANPHWEAYGALLSPVVLGSGFITSR